MFTPVADPDGKCGDAFLCNPGKGARFCSPLLRPFAVFGRLGRDMCGAAYVVARPGLAALAAPGVEPALEFGAGAFRSILIDDILLIVRCARPGNARYSVRG
jgi:hypothetical protein